MKLSDLLNNTTTKRDALKPAFNTGEIPTQQNFNELIDDLFLIQGDTLGKDATSGLGIQAGTDATKPVLHFYDDPAQEPAWTIGIQQGFELKDTAGNSRMTVLNDGKVGIGTNNPFANLTNQGLHISNGGHTSLILGDPKNAGEGGIIQTTDGRHRVFIGANIYDSGATWENFTAGKGVAGISIVADHSGANPGGVTWNSNAIDFIVSSLDRTVDNAAAYQPAMTITDSGSGAKVGIGTTDPLNTFHIVDTGTVTGRSLHSKAIATFEKNSTGYLQVLIPETGAETGVLFGKGGNNVAGGIIYNNEGSGSLQFRTLNNLPNMTIAGDGNIGIGTTDPNALLHVTNTSGATQINGNWMSMKCNSTSSSDYLPYIEWRTKSNNENTNRQAYLGWEPGYFNLKLENGYNFGIMGGKVGIGTSTPSYRLHVHSPTESWFGIETPSSTNNAGILLKKAGYVWQMYQPSNSNNLNFWNSSNSVVMSLTPGGNLQLRGQVTNLSDGRFKQNIQPISSGAIAKLTQLNGSTYQWRTEEHQEKGFEEGTYTGFVAQEVQALYPELVSEDQEGYLSINYTGLIPIIVEANKQQQQQIEDLQTQVSNLTMLISQLSKA